MPRIQRGPNNVAGNGDQVDLQVGEIKPADSRDRSSRQQPTPPPAGRSENVRTGNATVGEQADVITGGLRITF